MLDDENEVVPHALIKSQIRSATDETKTDLYKALLEGISNKNCESIKNRRETHCKWMLNLTGEEIKGCYGFLLAFGRFLKQDNNRKSLNGSSRANKSRNNKVAKTNLAAHFWCCSPTTNLWQCPAEDCQYSICTMEINCQEAD